MARPIVVLLGGLAKLGAAYRKAAQDAGRDLQHFERNHPSQIHAEAVLLCVPCCSHVQATAARDLAQQAGARVIFLRTTGVGTLRSALASLPVVQA